AAAELDDLADDVARIDGEERLIVELDEDGDRRSMRVLVAQRGDLCAERVRSCARDRGRPGQLAEGSQRNRYIGETERGDVDPVQVQRVEPRHDVRRRAR